LTIKAYYEWFPLFKLLYLNQGIKELDEAVNIAPEDITVRMIRANNSLALPAFTKRIDIAISDFEYLIKLSKKKKAFPKELLLQIYSGLSQAYLKKGNPKKAKEILNSTSRLFNK
jgi:tetratricopeptide (TPR) repeat protein